MAQSSRAKFIVKLTQRNTAENLPSKSVQEHRTRIVEREGKSVRHSDDQFLHEVSERKAKSSSAKKRPGSPTLWKYTHPRFLGVKRKLIFDARQGDDPAKHNTLQHEKDWERAPEDLFWMEPQSPAAIRVIADEDTACSLESTSVLTTLKNAPSTKKKDHSSPYVDEKYEALYRPSPNREINNVTTDPPTSHRDINIVPKGYSTSNRDTDNTLSDQSIPDRDTNIIPADQPIPIRDTNNILTDQPIPNRDISNTPAAADHPNQKTKRIRNPQLKLEAEKKKYTMKPSCASTCDRFCSTFFTHEERKLLWSDFRNLSKQDQRDYISRNVTRSATAVKTTGKEVPRRKYTLQWTIRDVVVCKTFFLNTLGFKNDQTIRTVLNANSKHGITDTHIQPAAPEQRGRKTPKHAFSPEYKETLTKFINDVQPTVSHYNLKHAPNRKYLPCGVTFTDLHNAFNVYCGENEIPTCSWAYFHNIVKALNLSTSNPRQDLCSVCKIHNDKHPEEQHNCIDCGCEECLKFAPHSVHKSLSRQLLQASTDEKHPKKAHFTVDMQKAICMPKLTVKEYFFSRKLVLLNETFVATGENQPAHCYIWHEGEAGRKAHNVASAYVAFLSEKCRDLEEVTLYTDNCTSQNKNRVLFAALIRLINTKNIHDLKTIKIIYLEPGHTYMAADTVHGCIANKFERSKNMYDLSDFIEKIEESRKNTHVRVLTHQDMIGFDDFLVKKFPRNYNIANLKIVEFRHGSHDFFVKKAYDELRYIAVSVSQAFKTAAADIDDFLKDLPRQTKPRGISQKKKEDLMKLCQSMPLTRRNFFKELNVDDEATDLDTVRDSLI